MEVVILAGGKGTRLRPYSNVLPKPLMPVGNYPILEIVLRSLHRQGFRHVTLSVGHLAHLIEAYFGDGRRWDLSLRYVRESTPLGTAGPLALVDFLTDDFVVMNGDILTDLDFRAMIARHRSSGAPATLARYAKTLRPSLGVVETDAAGKLTAYHEKPALHYEVSMGIYVMHRSVVELFTRRGRRLDLPDLMLRLLEAGERVATYPHDGLWLDIGRPEDYEAAQEILERNATELLRTEPPA